MKPLFEALSSPEWNRLVYTLLHSLWLGVVWAGVLALLLRSAGNNPEKRYRYGLGTLAGLIFSVLVAWSIQETANRQPTPQLAQAAAAIPSSTRATEAPTTIDTAPVENTMEPSKPSSISWIPFVALFWLAGLVFMCGRLVTHLVASGRIRRASTLISDATIVKLSRELQQLLGMKRLVQIASNATVLIPGVVGVFSPMILLPASMVSGLPPEQLRAILLHELAHIRRHDYLVNILQQMVEALLFFNPAMWWINRQIRLEREACCDALAVRASAEPRQYAATLTEFAQTFHDRRNQLQTAFPGDRQPSTLLERIRRLLVTDYQPMVRLPWYSFVSVLLFASVLLFGAWRGTKFAVSLAAEILSPEQRIEKIEQLQANASFEQREYTTNDNIQVAGQIGTADGEPLPEGLQLHIEIAMPHGGKGFGPIPLKNGHFELVTDYGSIYLGALPWKGYGPAFVGPFRTTPGGAITNIDIVLPKGFQGAVRVTDTQGKALDNVELEGSYQFPTGSVPIKLTTDTNGQASFEHCIEAPMRWSAKRNGFQASVREGVKLKENEPFSWALERSRTTAGQIRSQVDHKPIANAKIKLLYRSGGSVMGDLASAPLLAETDNQGRFKLDSLPEQATHIIAIEAPGFATTLVREVVAGRENLEIELGPDISIEGRIEGDLSQLIRMPDPVIQVGSPIQIGPHHYSHVFNRTVPVQIDGEVGRFAVSNLFEGEVVISAGERRFEYILKESNKDLVLKLAHTNAPTEVREVVVQFQVPPGAPPIKGQLKVTRWSDTNPNSTQTWIPIENNEARFTAPVMGWASWAGEGLVGYWTPQNHATKVPKGSAPFTISVLALPAGAIHGKVFEADGSEISDVLLSVIEAKSAPGKQGALGDLGKNTASPNDGPTRFVAQPLPLGGDYVIVAHRGNQYVASEKISLTTNQPIRAVNLRVVPGEELSGVVLNHRGEPLSRVPVSLLLNTPFNHGFGIVGFGNQREPVTDSNGRFKIQGLNPTIPGHYTVIIDQQPGYLAKKQEVAFGKEARITLIPGEKFNATVLNEETGNPIEGVEFYAFPLQFQIDDSHVNADAKSDSNGRFEFTRLAQRDYRLSCRDGEIVKPAQNPTIRPGSTEPLVISIKPHPGSRLWERGELLGQAAKN